MWWCQFIDWLKFETRPSSLMNFGTANMASNYKGLYGIFYKIIIVCVKIQYIVCCRLIRAPADACFVQSVKHAKLDFPILV